MLSTVPAPIFNVELFDRFPANKSMSQEASTLGLKPGCVPMGRLSVYSNTLGLLLQFHSAGSTAWEFVGEDKSGEDVAGWRFRPTAATVVKHPALSSWTLLIIND